jgi:putative membrane protein
VSGPNQNIERELDTATRLSVDRTRIAHDRTMLAWVRTATALITFGFTVSNFSGLLRPAPDSSGYLLGPRQFGFILVCIGLASLAVAVLEHRQAIRDLGTAYYGKRRSMAVIVAAFVAALGIFALFAMIFRA